MATSSISKNVIIDNSNIDNFVKALEFSENQKENHKYIDKNVVEIKGEDIRRFFDKVRSYGDN